MGKIEINLNIKTKLITTQIKTSFKIDNEDTEMVDSFKVHLQIVKKPRNTHRLAHGKEATKALGKSILTSYKHQKYTDNGSSCNALWKQKLELKIRIERVLTI